jgi:Zn-dependent membrane protease YugP
MVVILALFSALFLALIFGPQLWVTATMRRHGADRPEYPGTGGELARHLLDEAGLEHVKVERVAGGRSLCARRQGCKAFGGEFRRPLHHRRGGCRP